MSQMSGSIKNRYICLFSTIRFQYVLPCFLLLKDVCAKEICLHIFAQRRTVYLDHWVHTFMLNILSIKLNLSRHICNK